MVYNTLNNTMKTGDFQDVTDITISWQCPFVNDVRPRKQKEKELIRICFSGQREWTTKRSGGENERCPEKRRLTDRPARVASDLAISNRGRTSGCCLTDRGSVSSVLANRQMNRISSGCKTVPGRCGDFFLLYRCATVFWGGLSCVQCRKRYKTHLTDVFVSSFAYV